MENTENILTTDSAETERRGGVGCTAGLGCVGCLHHANDWRLCLHPLSVVPSFWDDTNDYSCFTPVAPGKTILGRTQSETCLVKARIGSDGRQFPASLKCSPQMGNGAAGAQMQGRARDMASQQTKQPNVLS